jgi:hypothetical protein
MKRRKKGEKEAPSALPTGMQAISKFQINRKVPNSKFQTRLFHLFDDWSLGFV